MSRSRVFLHRSLFVWLASAFSWVAAAGELRLRPEQICDTLEVGYAVSLEDVNRDEKTDIVVVDTTRVIWFENPSWKLHTFIQDQTKRDNVCLAPYDIDGDGRLDFALGADWRPMDTKTGGTIQWLRRGAAVDERCSVHPIGEEPTVHRMRWVDLDGDGKCELIVVPLMGRGATRPLWSEHPLRILAFQIPADPVNDTWPVQTLNEELHVAHNFWPTDLNADGQVDLLLASYEGVSLLERKADGSWKRTLIGEGNQQTAPDRGASEIKHGKLAGGADYIATIEPWHGFQVVAYTRPDVEGHLWNRQVLDEDLRWGHAVWCVNLDGDPDQELVVGVRDNKDERALSGLRVYDPQDAGGRTWRRLLFDPGGVSIEDLAAADLNGDGRQDIVAVGRQTKNVRIYWNETE